MSAVPVLCISASLIRLCRVTATLFETLRGYPKGLPAGLIQTKTLRQNPFFG